MGFRITYNAPVVITFALAAALLLFFDLPFETSLVSPAHFSWRGVAGMLGHPFLHAGWDHYLANFSLILLLGPILEEKYGSRKILAMMIATALLTGAINAALTDNGLVGASGIVFMCILLASTANIRRGEVPLTFLAIAVLYLGREGLRAFESNQISELSHVIGGVVGGFFGFLFAGTGAASSPSTGMPVR